MYNKRQSLHSHVYFVLKSLQIQNQLRVLFSQTRWGTQFPTEIYVDYMYYHTNERRNNTYFFIYCSPISLKDSALYSFIVVSIHKCVNNF